MKSNSQSFPFDQIVLVGGTGQTGRRLLQLLSVMSSVVATSRTSGSVHNKAVNWFSLDLELDSASLAEQLQNIYASGLKPNKKNLLIFAAAFTNVEGCESDPQKCIKINEKNTIAVLDWAHAVLKAKVVFYSTDYVFDGADGPYGEQAVRCPLSQYGESKKQIEEWLEKNMLKDSLVIRTTGVFDLYEGSKNFLMQALGLLQDKKEMRVPNDQLANPVCAYELAKATVELIVQGHSGIFHVAGGTYLSRYAFTQEIAKAFHLDTSLIKPVLTSALNQKAKRPLKGGLLNDKLKQKIGWSPRPVEEVLKEFAASF